MQIDRRCLAEAMLANGPGTRRQFQQPRQTLMQALFRTGIECARQMHCTINGVAHVMVATALVDSLSAAILFTTKAFSSQAQRQAGLVAIVTGPRAMQYVVLYFCCSRVGETQSWSADWLSATAELNLNSRCVSNHGIRGIVDSSRKELSKVTIFIWSCVFFPLPGTHLGTSDVVKLMLSIPDTDVLFF